ncbi:hypothetical protein H696_03542 [Fonticula alba]|uniref:Uncharacterized protein n=1 Tax=Fonticula alba TaxID=691883 RepID=A0A058Z751_FONAL|nr:hypothetical protein H696_03542 [Fonticula alba]KCV70080.1 hypothetical protein H696_03542 [Fonticula alba]|eukprot:XP_009495686.1 hypothetical protein H696_03542 [Fonticula alba]
MPPDDASMSRRTLECDRPTLDRFFEALHQAALGHLDDFLKASADPARPGGAGAPATGTGLPPGAGRRGAATTASAARRQRLLESATSRHLARAVRAGTLPMLRLEGSATDPDGSAVAGAYQLPECFAPVVGPRATGAALAEGEAAATAGALAAGATNVSTGAAAADAPGSGPAALLPEEPFDTSALARLTMAQNTWRALVADIAPRRSARLSDIDSRLKLALGRARNFGLPLPLAAASGPGGASPLLLGQWLAASHSRLGHAERRLARARARVCAAKRAAFIRRLGAERAAFSTLNEGELLKLAESSATTLHELKTSLPEINQHLQDTIQVLSSGSSNSSSSSSSSRGDRPAAPTGAASHDHGGIL